MPREQKIIRGEVGLPELARQLGSVGQACRVMGDSRDSFDRFRALCEKRGELALAAMSRRVPLAQNRAAPEVEAAAGASAVERPAWGRERAANALRQRGLAVSPFGVRCIWLRHALQTRKRRLKAREAKVAQDGLVLTDSPLVAREKPRQEEQARGEFESECPATAWRRTRSMAAP